MLPSKVYKMLRSSAVASEKLVTEAMREASGRSQEVQNVMERRKGKGLIVDYMDSEIGGSDTLLDATHNGDGSIDSTAAVALAAILGDGSVDKLLYTLRSLVTLDGKNYLMADDVRRQMLSVGSTPADNMLLKGKGKQAAASLSESNKTPNVMFHCGDEISVSVDAAAAASASATDFYKRRADHVLRFFSERQLVSLREAYEDLAAAEELHMKMSYMFADCSAALVDLSDCMRFLLDRFGCDRWSQGVTLQDNIYPGPSMYADPDSELHRPVLHEFEAAPQCKLTVTVDKLTRQSANIDELKQELTSWIGETRDPFVLVELVKKENRERLGVLDHSANSYMSDVHTIRIFIAEALNLQKKSKSAATDAENRSKLHDMVCRLACAYGDGRCNENVILNSVFDALIGSKSRELFASPERVWIQAEFFRIQRDYQNLTRKFERLQSGITEADAKFQHDSDKFGIKCAAELKAAEQGNDKEAMRSIVDSINKAYQDKLFKLTDSHNRSRVRKEEKMHSIQAEQIPLESEMGAIVTELLFFRGDINQLASSVADCVDATRLQTGDSKLSMDELAGFALDILSEISGTGASYFNVFRRNQIRNHRLFSSAAHDMWTQIEFVHTVESRRVFDGDNFHDDDDYERIDLELGPGVSDNDDDERGDSEGDADQDGGAVDRLDQMTRAEVEHENPEYVLSNLFESRKAWDALGLNVSFKPPSNVYRFERCELNIPDVNDRSGAASNGILVDEPFDDDSWGVSAPVKHALPLEKVKQILLGRYTEYDRIIWGNNEDKEGEDDMTDDSKGDDDDDDGMDVDDEGSAANEIDRGGDGDLMDRIGRLFLRSSIPDRYIRALSMMLHHGVSPNSAARVMNSIPESMQSMQVEACVRAICHAASAGGGRPDTSSQSPIRVNTIKLIGYNEWAPFHRGVLISMCFCMMQSYDNEKKKLTAKASSPAKDDAMRDLDLKLTQVYGISPEVYSYLTKIDK